MKKPVLVIMAAGMGSRYGGLKQIDPVDEDGHIIIDFSIYDAKRAGFQKVVFIIRREHEEDFRKSIGDRVSKFMEVEYVYQELENLPEGFSVPEGRTKPFGTGHAILSCKDVVDGPFAVINADDYYGVNAYKMIYDYLSSGEDNEKYRYAMVGYMLSNTLTENGYVSRGICDTDENQCLTGITERTHIEKTKDGAAFTEDDGKTWVPVALDTTVSMNLFGFTASMLKELESRFSANPVHCLQTLHVFSLQILSASLPPPAITEENGMEYSVVLQSSPRNLFCDDMLFSPCLSDKRIFLRPPRRMDETHIRDDLFSYDRER